MWDCIARTIGLPRDAFIAAEPIDIVAVIDLRIDTRNAISIEIQNAGIDDIDQR